MCVKFQHFSSNSFRDRGGPKFTLGAVRPSHAASEKSHTRKVHLTLSKHDTTRKCQLSSSNRYEGVQNLHQGAYHVPSGKFSYQKRVL